MSGFSLTRSSKRERVLEEADTSVGAEENEAVALAGDIVNPLQPPGLPDTGAISDELGKLPEDLRDLMERRGCHWYHSLPE